MDPRGSHPPSGSRGLSEADTADFCFSNTHGRVEHRLPSSFLSATEPRAQYFPARAAIALELVRRRAQQVDRCGACVVAHGGCGVAHCDGCAALAVVASRVSQWPQLEPVAGAVGVREWAEWPERLPAPRPLGRLQHSRKREAPWLAPKPSRESIFRRETFSLIIHLPISRLPGPVRQSKTIAYEYRLNIHPRGGAIASSPHLRVTGRFKHNRHPSISTSWTHKARLQP